MLTAETITDEQIRELQASLPANPEFGSFDWARVRECLIALHDCPGAADYPSSSRRILARARIAAILNTKNARVTK